MNENNKVTHIYMILSAVYILILEFRFVSGSWYGGESKSLLEALQYHVVSSIARSSVGSMINTADINVIARLLLPMLLSLLWLVISFAFMKKYSVKFTKKKYLIYLLSLFFIFWFAMYLDPGNYLGFYPLYAIRDILIIIPAVYLLFDKSFSDKVFFIFCALAVVSMPPLLVILLPWLIVFYPIMYFLSKKLKNNLSGKK